MKQKTDTLILIKAMRRLADDIQSEDGVANAAIEEAADQLAELERENAELMKDKERLDFLATLTGSGWACLHLNRKGTNDDWLLTRKQIDRRMATEPKP